eukprot:scaffold504738_cov23-Prasinocladus_malaysianus.AAC.1
MGRPNQYEKRSVSKAMSNLAKKGKFSGTLSPLVVNTHAIPHNGRLLVTPALTHEYNGLLCWTAST